MSEKLGYSLTKMLILLEINMKTPNTQDFHQKNHTVRAFLCGIHQKLGTFHEIFLKNLENRNI